MKSNLIKCRFCDWTTHKWGNDSTPEKAFERLFNHIEGYHHANKLAGQLERYREETEELELRWAARRRSGSDQ